MLATQRHLCQMCLPAAARAPPCGNRLVAHWSIENPVRPKGGVVMRKIFCLVITAVLVALPLSAAQNIIYRGVDLWNTTDDGSTHVDFAKKPIPAGFFCSTSLPFTGRIEFRGVPIATGVARELGTTDTIVERLDDAVFNKRGVATTRIRFRALQMESIAPIKTTCGSFNVRVQLAEVEQPVTRMRIVRENKDGGRF